MPSLSEFTGRTRALRNVKEVELEDIPKLTKCTLLTAFKCVEKVKMRNAGDMEGMEVLKNATEKMEERRKKEEEERREAMKRKAVIASKMDWDGIDHTVGRITVHNNRCNEETFVVLDFSRCVYLKELKIGNECFMYVEEVKLIGLSELESVEIGMNSFTQHKDSYGNDPNRHFYLRNCPKLKSLKIDRNSFSDYTVCEIENVDALEEITMMGDREWGYWSGVAFRSSSFYYASLELRSILIHNE